MSKVFVYWTFNACHHAMVQPALPHLLSRRREPRPPPISRWKRPLQRLSHLSCIPSSAVLLHTRNSIFGIEYVPLANLTLKLHAFRYLTLCLWIVLNQGIFSTFIFSLITLLFRKNSKLLPPTIAYVQITPKPMFGLVYSS